VLAVAHHGRAFPNAGVGADRPVDPRHAPARHPSAGSALPGDATTGEGPLRVSQGHEDLWRVHAECHGQPTSWWFPTNGSAEQARTVCAGCPVRADCLQAALADVEEHGIWGGASERIRRLLRRQWKQSPHPRSVECPPGCRCTFGRTLARHFDRLDRFAADQQRVMGTIPTNGPGVTHGRAATYARGCRCARCREAITESRKRNLRKPDNEEEGAA
jgi:hypothetical protein